MGLDMYAYTSESAIGDVDFETPADSSELFYWRKHPNLHGWMESLYRVRGGTDESFNVSNLKLTLADLDQLEKAVREKKLPYTQGFFFGVSDGTELEADLTFIRKAREALLSGLSVYYTCGW